MALLTRDSLDKVIKLLVAEGLVDANEVARVQNEVMQTKQPLLATLQAQKVTTDEQIAQLQLW